MPYVISLFKCKSNGILCQKCVSILYIVKTYKLNALDGRFGKLNNTDNKN